MLPVEFQGLSRDKVHALERVDEVFPLAGLIDDYVIDCIGTAREAECRFAVWLGMLVHMEDPAPAVAHTAADSVFEVARRRRGRAEPSLP